MAENEWYGEPPEECDICKSKLTFEFVDGATILRSWAFMCDPCHIRYGRGLGTGKGQKYRKSAAGIWVKVLG